MKSFGRNVSTLALLGVVSVAISACGMFRDDEVAVAQPAQPAVAAAPQPTTVQVQPVRPMAQEEQFQRTLQK